MYLFDMDFHPLITVHPQAPVRNLDDLDVYTSSTQLKFTVKSFVLMQQYCVWDNGYKSDIWRQTKIASETITVFMRNRLRRKQTDANIYL